MSTVSLEFYILCFSILKFFIVQGVFQLLQKNCARVSLQQEYDEDYEPSFVGSDSEAEGEGTPGGARAYDNECDEATTTLRCTPYCRLSLVSW